MKQKTIFADKLQPFRLNDKEYIEMLEDLIDNVDDVIQKEIREMDKAFLDVEEISEHVLFLHNKWKLFKASLCFHGSDLG